MAPIKPQVITTTFGADSHDVEFQAILKAGQEKYRATIRRNSYERQSVAKVEILLLAAGWVEMVNLHADDWAKDIHEPIAGPKVTRETRKAQMQELAIQLTVDAHRAYTA